MRRKRYVDKHNQDIVDRVVKEVKSVDSGVPSFQIRGQYKLFHTIVLCLSIMDYLLQKLESDFFTLNLRRSL